MNSDRSLRVVAVVVAYNRRELLRAALEALSRQTHTVDALVVVDNASTDGTSEVVRDVLPGADLLVSELNTGGAGGFALGLAQAVGRHRADWVWLMDDDTIPAPTALEEALAAIGRAEDTGHPVAVVGSRVVWTDGSDHPMNTPRRRPFAPRAERAWARSVGVMAVRSSSFVSMFVDARAVEEDGLPIADYFIWNDDFEFSTRLLRSRRGIFAPSSVVVHKTRALGSTDVDPGERFFYEVRNKLWLFRRSSSLAPWEKGLYGGATFVRWVRTIARSTNRRVLLRGLRSGLRAGWRSAPRSNRVVLAGVGGPVLALDAFDRAASARRSSG